jgi:2-hydroxychromene-2-carboxylate isomerase
MPPSSPLIEFFFDVGSPYAYLAATQVRGIEERTAARVRWRPYLLGAVLKGSGNTMPAQVPAKARYMVEDLARWGAYYGVPIALSSHFPINSLRPQRALVAAGKLAGEDAIPRFALGLYKGYWVDDRDVSVPETIREVADGVGLDGAAILAATESQDVKDTLRAATEEALARGAFGAPTFYVGDAMFWGNDRLVLLEWHLRSLAKRGA